MSVAKVFDCRFDYVPACPAAILHGSSYKEKNCGKESIAMFQSCSEQLCALM